MSEVTMPGLSDSMTEATIVRWLKEDGEHVEQGDELLEIETDKATMSCQAEAAGLLQIVVPEGTTVPVGTLIAEIAKTYASDPAVTPAEIRPVETDAAPLVDGATASPHAETAPVASGDGFVRATPLARLLARTHEIDLQQVPGTGPRGRVTRADVARRAGIAATGPPAPLTIAGGPNGHPAESVTTQELTGVQRRIARRMVEAKATVPEFQVQTEVTMDAVLALREQLRPSLDDQVLPSLNDFVIKASALALREHPRVNAAYQDGGFELYTQINIGIAVATDDALIVPVVIDADKRALTEIAAETRRLAQLVRCGAITPSDLANGTFTISNLGMFGMTAITPVINPPQAAILGVGATRETLQLHNGQPAATHRITLTLTCDHRILYGADAARFLSGLVDLLQQPLQLLL